MASHGWRAYLPYVTSRRLRVDVWQLGLAFKLLQLAIVIGIGLDIFYRNGWAYSEVPAGRVNAYGESTSDFKATLNASTEPKYCGSTQHNYVFSSLYTYEQPSCRDIDVEEVVTKSIGAVTFTTSVIETIEFSWNCRSRDEENGFKAKRCVDMDGQKETSGDAGEQCKCSRRETYYVKGVEDMGIVFEHGYSTTIKAGELTGSSAVAQGLDTRVGSEVFKDGKRILLSLQKLIALNNNNITLDKRNKAVVRTRGRRSVVKDTFPDTDFPYFRTTGMKLTVDINYENLDGNQATLGNKDVDALIKVSAAGGWAGPGPQVFYTQAPTTDKDGARTYEKMIRYRQGVEVVFRPSGLAYWLDYQHFINVFLGAYLFLAVAVYVMDFVTFNVLPNGVSKVLYAKRAERVSKVHSFAQLGLRAAVAVKDFKALDVDNQGYVEVKDLVSVFGTIPSVTKEEAMMMAQTIMRAADCDTSLQGRLTFNEFMSLFDGTTALDFDQFVKLVHTTGREDKLDEGARNAASQAYDDVEAGVDLAARRSGSTDELTASQPSQMNCFLCKTLFGVPPGAKLTKCPHCLTVNPTTTTAPAQPGFLGGLHITNLSSRFHIASQPETPRAQISGGNPSAQVQASRIQQDV